MFKEKKCKEIYCTLARAYYSFCCEMWYITMIPSEIFDIIIQLIVIIMSNYTDIHH